MGVIYAEFSLSLCLVFSEIVGDRPRSAEADSDESVHNVDGRQHYLHFSDHDGWHDVHPAYPGAARHPAE